MFLQSPPAVPLLAIAQPQAVSLSDTIARLRCSGEQHIPAQDMLDFALGGLDEEIMQALHGSHLKACRSCSRGLEAYRAERPVDPARLAEVPEFQGALIDSTTYGLTPSEAGERLRKFIEEGQGPLFIVAGEANPAVYTEEVSNALRWRAEAARQRGEPIPKIICGPAMGVVQGRPPLVTVAAEGHIELAITRHRQKFHFRVSGATVYTEAYHRAGNEADRQGYWYHSRPVAELLRRRFEAILRGGLSSPARAEEFVFLTMDQIRALEARYGEGFDGLTADDLRAAVGRS